jgi:plastocyanin
MQEIWNGILELTSRFVIPDWGSVVALLPLATFIIVVVVLLRLFWLIGRADPPRRGKGPVRPRTPAGLHMPGPSWSPIFAAIGVFLLFLGLVYGGAILLLGGIALALTLLYWLAEGLRIYDHDIGETVPKLPAVTHDGPPPGVHMPGPSFRPIIGAIGVTMVMLGLVYGGWLLLAGVIALTLTLVGWLVDSVAEYRRTIEADRTGHLASGPAPRTPRLLLWTLVVLLIGGAALQFGWLPPGGAAGGEAAAQPSGEPAASGEPPPSAAPAGSGAPPASATPADVTLTAVNIAFDQSAITAPAARPWTLALVNEDSAPHNVEFKDAAGASLFAGEPFSGPATQVYDVPAIEAGEYTFLCTVHPSMTGTATFQ